MRQNQTIIELLKRSPVATADPKSAFKRLETIEEYQALKEWVIEDNGFRGQVVGWPYINFSFV
jgi:hypothetical protein